MKCPICGSGTARAIYAKDGAMRPQPLGQVTCCNPACRVAIDSKTNKTLDELGAIR